MNVELIRALCKERGTNIKQMEIALGLGNGTVARWDQQDPSVTRAKAVADYLGVSVEALIQSGKESP